MKSIITHFTSDQHLNHVNILKYDRRPFRDIDEMRRVIVDRYNATVPENGVTLWLGDAFLGMSKDDATGLLESMNGQKILVRGNHDRKGKQWFLDVGFMAVGDTYLIEDEVVGCVMCVHNPINAATSKGTDAVIHGHKHSTSPYSSLNGIQRYDVGVIANGYYPISYRDVMIELKRGTK
jgi:calcineurin-like phosphoesterase family protein